MKCESAINRMWEYKKLVNAKLLQFRCFYVCNSCLYGYMKIDEFLIKSEWKYDSSVMSKWNSWKKNLKQLTIV